MSPERGQARLLASGSLAQQAAQVAGLVAMLVVVTVLARRLPLQEFGAYGLFTSIGGYLIVVQSSAAAATVRALAAARDDGARDAVFSTACLLYAAAGAVAGALLALIGLVLAEAIDLSAAAERSTREGAALLGLVTAVGWPLTIWRDALRADQRFVGAALAELGALAAWLAVMLALALGDASLALLIAASGGIPLFAGLACALLAARARLGYRFRRAAATSADARRLGSLAGYVSLNEAAAAGIYALDRVILGLFRSATTVGLFEGPVRAHNVFRALGGATTVTALPTAARYHAAGDDRRLRELVLRGARYTVALAVPLAVTGMVLAKPVLEVWLGEGFGRGGAALTILLSHWLVNGMGGVAIAVLVGVDRARDVARYALGVAGANLALALALTPPFGLEGVAIATAGSYGLMFPYLIRLLADASGVAEGELFGRAFLPAWGLGVVLAGALVALRLALEPDSLGVVLVLAVGAPLAYWVAFYGLVLDGDERQLVKEVAGGVAPLGARSGSAPAALTLRPAAAEDEARLLEWRNDPDVQASSRSGRPVTRDEHAAWFTDVLSDPSRELLIAERGDRPVGQVRFDTLSGSACEISVSLTAGERGRGRGTELIRACLAWLAERGDTGRVEAHVRPDNTRSLAAFEASGFRREPELREGMVVLVAEPPA